MFIYDGMTHTVIDDHIRYVAYGHSLYSASIIESMTHKTHRPYDAYGYRWYDAYDIRQYDLYGHRLYGINKHER